MTKDNLGPETVHRGMWWEKGEQEGNEGGGRSEIVEFKGHRVNSELRCVYTCVESDAMSG